MTSAPSIAPYGWPTPPSTAAAMTGIRNAEPVVKSKLPSSVASATPASPHSSPDSSQAPSMTRRVCTPQLRASAGSLAVARMALPSRVYLSRPCNAASATAAIAITMS